MTDKASVARIVSLDVLVGLQAGTGKTDFAMDRLDRLAGRANLDARDRALAMELITGVIRMQGTLDRVISVIASRPGSRIDPVVRWILRLGAYQMIYLESVPTFAAVDESVQLAWHRRCGQRTAGFVNAVLRNIERAIEHKRAPADAVEHATHSIPVDPDTVCVLRMPAFVSPDKDQAGYVSQAYSHPVWLIRRWLASRSFDEVRTICTANNIRPVVTVRPNLLRCRPAEGQSAANWLANLLEAQGCRCALCGEDAGMVALLSAPAITDLPAYDEGLFQVQDTSATEAVRRLEPHGGQKVLDLCAAPGTKTTQMAEMMGNHGRIVACDVDEEGLALVADNCRRLGIDIVEAVPRTQADEMIAAGQRFDRVLVDAPCSNTAVLARRVEARWRLRAQHLKVMASRQQALLEQALEAARSGAFVIYSTCSVDRQENSDVVRAVLKRYTSCSLMADGLIMPSWQTVAASDDGRQYLHSDGAYWALLRKI